MRSWLIPMMLSIAGPCAAQISAPPFAPDSAQLGSGEATEILGVLCPGQAYAGQENGCRVCPATTKMAGARGEASIIAAVRGHFLKPDSDDLLLSLNGCGAALLTHSSSGWFVDPAKNLPDGVCHKIPSHSGRDGLICYEAASTEDHDQGRLTFADLAGDQRVDLLAAFDNTAGACDALQRTVVQSAIQAVQFVPGAGGRLTVSITARCRRGPLSQRSRTACARGPGFQDIGPATVFRTFRMQYAFNGDGFSLVAASRTAKQAYDLCAAEAK